MVDLWAERSLAALGCGGHGASAESSPAASPELSLGFSSPAQGLGEPLGVLGAGTALQSLALSVSGCAGRFEGVGVSVLHPLGPAQHLQRQSSPLKPFLSL